MDKKLTNPNIRQELRKKKIVLNSFTSPKTMLMVSRETGIFRSTICGIVAKAMNEGKLRLMKKSSCPVSGFKAGFYQQF